MPLYSDQQSVFDQAMAFIDAPRVDRPYFYFTGAAGTGKTQVLGELAKVLPEAIACVPIGKVASVLSRRTGIAFDTIHSAIYRFQGQHTGDDGLPFLAFKQRILDGSWRGLKALVDEAGVIGQDLGRDLFATGCRAIVCGDDNQLRPVRSTRYFERPDARLTTVRRQALESAVLRQAHNVLNTGQYQADGPDFRVQRTVGRDDILAADVILCWRNATRQALNALVRAHKGIDGPPNRGEQVVCLRNNRDLGVLNGARYELLADYNPRERVAILCNERGRRVEIENCRFEGVDPPGDPDDWEEQPLAFGNAMTVHKYIGSESEQGILVDEYDRYDDRQAFVYTGITRFAKRVLVHSMWT